MRRSLSALLLLALAAPLSAGYYAKAEVDAVTVRVGETVEVRVDALYFPWSVVEFRPIVFESSNPRFIKVTGRMSLPQTSYIRIVGIRPGHVQALFATKEGNAGAVDVTVVCGKEPAIQTAEAQQRAKIGEPVTLRAVSPIAERTTFTWYRGLVGDMSAPIAAAGPELELTPNEPGQHYAWVMATTPCSSSTAQFEIEAFAPKRRGVRH